MATPYETIFNRFAQKITDFHLAEVDDFSLDEMLNSWLKSAIIRTRKCEHDLSLRDDEAQEFTEDLSDVEIELLALGMVDAWVTPMLNSTELTLQFVGSKEAVRKQIGMAVPAKGAEVVMHAVLQTFAGIDYDWVKPTPKLQLENLEKGDVIAIKGLGK